MVVEDGAVVVVVVAVVPFDDDPGAPTVPKLGRKLIWTTAVTCVIFAACYVAYTDHLVSLDSLMARFGPPNP